jgi:hypothetical protein
MDESRYVLRTHSRYHVETPILFAKQNTDSLLPANMLNISDGGMCFESRYEVNPHSDVCIWLEKKLRVKLKGIQIYNFYRSRVLWCREINKGTALGIGVQHVNKTRVAQVPEFICSVCEKKIPLGEVHFVKDFVYLCPICYEEMQSYSKNSQDEMLRFLEGNVC